MRSPQFGRRHNGGCGSRNAEEHHRHRHDQAVFHHLLEAHGQIERVVELLPDGIRTVTTSSDPALAGQIQAHVHSMHERLQINLPLRRWDRLYAELFRHREAVQMVVRNLANGVEVIETSDHPEVVKLIQAHSRTVNAFISRGPAASQQPGAFPSDYVG